MGPASSGGLARYVGTCLISHSNNSSVEAAGGTAHLGRAHYYDRGYSPNDVYYGNYSNIDGRFHVQMCNPVEEWAGGMPLISFANRQKRIKRPDHDRKDTSSRYEDQHSPLARLAIHTQGAPLILTKPCYKKNKAQKKSPRFYEASDTLERCMNDKCKDVPINANIADTVSIASDESSGSANSDNCLPRIIKPRKRRKKDRKPLLRCFPTPEDFPVGTPSPDVLDPSSNVMNLSSYIPFNFEVDNPNLSCGSFPPLIDRVHDIGNVTEHTTFHNRFEDTESFDDGEDVNGNQILTTGQCGYCDPSGLTWDVHTNCYSPLSTTPNRGSIFQFPEITLDSLLHSSSSSDYIVENMRSLSLKGECDAKKSDCDQSLVALPRASSDLEVSTEIVTSLNGHRDLEIKFFSLPSVSEIRRS